MPDTTWRLPPDLEAAIAEFYVASEPSPAFAARLEQELRQRQTDMLQYKTQPVIRFAWSKRSKIMQSVRTRPVLALIVVLIALLLLTGAAYAIGRLKGYIPGFGFTTDIQSVFLLSEPVEVAGEGITLRVDQAVSDESMFWVSLTVTGLPDEHDSSRAFVFLPNGEKIPFQMSSGVAGDSEDIHWAYVFPPLPAVVTDLVLYIENLDGQNFSAPIHLRPAKPGDILPSEPQQPGQWRSVTQDGVTLVLDQVAPSSDKTVFQVSVHFDKLGMSLNSDWNVLLTDQKGAVYPAIDITPESIDGNAKIFQTLPFIGNEQLTVSLNVFPNAQQLPISVDFSLDDANGFRFDPGPDPAVGQTWALDKVIQISGFTLRVLSARLESPGELLFEFEPTGKITGVMLYTPDPSLRGATGGVPQVNGNILAGMTFENIPAHPFEVRVTRVYYTAHGSWEIQWQPPSAPHGTTVPPAVTFVPTQPPYATPTLASSDPIVLEVQQLAQQFDAPFQEGPAWIHVVSEGTMNPRAGQTFPPPYIISEQWIETDANGYVIRSVWLDKDADGNTIQLSATVEDYSVNFTTGDAGFNRGQPYHFSADMLSHDLAQAKQNGNLVTRDETTCAGGQPCIAVTSMESFPEPILIAGETQAFIGAGNTVWINLATGQQIQFQSFWRLEDGTNRVESTERNLILEKVSSPPQEILDILAKVIVP
ncbi:MAG: hypothetical protein B6D39_08145 [Anaerolineae bacterium UTCFX2]|jgi:hypothetical protein|nr:MAG: hypothetical protein B6D39_08145 [Anaerolineae bacterium UTCFX2]